jgi:glycosyltransferase involved in cell wall biosynthesis
MGEFLPEAVESVLQYSPLQDIEIIIVNDGSTDQYTLEVLQDIKNKHSFITIIDQKNQGLANARNKGIKLSQGQYILPLDADNKIRPVYISESIKIFESNKDIDIVYGNKQLFGLKNNSVKVRDFNFPALCKNNYIDACAVFRKTVWDKLNGYDINMPIMGYEDWDFWLRAALAGAKFYHLNEICFDYRVRENSMVAGSIKNHHKIVNYMHNKKELYVVPQVAEAYTNALKYHQLTHSNTYKVYDKIITPIKNIFIKK